MTWVTIWAAAFTVITTGILVCLLVTEWRDRYR